MGAEAAAAAQKTGTTPTWSIQLPRTLTKPTGRPSSSSATADVAAPLVVLVELLEPRGLGGVGEAGAVAEEPTYAANRSPRRACATGTTSSRRHQDVRHGAQRVPHHRLGEGALEAEPRIEPLGRRVDVLARHRQGYAAGTLDRQPRAPPVP